VAEKDDHLRSSGAAAGGGKIDNVDRRKVNIEKKGKPLRCGGRGSETTQGL